jgi:hypothetical protein
MRAQRNITSLLLSSLILYSFDLTKSMTLPRAIHGETMQIASVDANVSVSIPMNGKMCSWINCFQTSASREKACGSCQLGNTYAVYATDSVDLDAFFTPIGYLELFYCYCDATICPLIYIGKPSPANRVPYFANIDSMHVKWLWELVTQGRKFHEEVDNMSS